MSASSLRGINRVPAIFLFTLVFIVLHTNNPAAVTAQEDPLEAINIFETAEGLRQAQNYDRAAVQYARVINKYPETQVAAQSYYQMGICQFEDGKFKLAATNFDSFLQHKKKDQAATLIPYALYNLGLSCYEVARAADAQDAESVQRAIKAFDNLEKDHADSDLVEMAIFFRSQSRFLVNDLEGAVKDLTRIIEKYPDSTYHSAAIVDLGATYVEMGKYSEAIKLYDQFLNSKTNDPATNEVKLRKLDCQLQLALKNETVDPQSTQSTIQQLAQQYQALANIDGFNLTYHALAQQAFCLEKTGQNEAAAKVFFDVTQRFPENPASGMAQISAARNYDLAGKPDMAIQLLQSAMENQPQHAVEAAWMLCSLDLRNKRHEQAYQRASQFAEKADGTRFHAPLLFIMAQAAYQLPNRIDESTKLFNQIAKEFPDQSIASEALYNAAFNQLQQRNSADVIAIAEQFEKKYTDSIYYPEVIELHAEALLLEQKRAEAQVLFKKLVNEFPKHSLANKWLLRLAETVAIQGKYQDAIALINANLDTMSTDQQKANALYLLGLNYFNVDENEKAADALKKSYQANSQWKHAAAVVLLQARTSLRLNKNEEARQFITAVLNHYPDSENRDEAIYRAGQIAESANDLDKAAQYYQTLVSEHTDSTWTPDATYKLAWVRSRQNQYQDAVTLLSTLIKSQPESSLATDALLARGINQRLSGNASAAIDDLKQFISLAGTESNLPAARYELALAYSADGKHSEVVDTLLPLLEQQPQPDFADGIHYELGWAYLELKQPKESVKQFNTIVENFPDSNHAAEANFHVGEDFYEQKEYATAQNYYQASIEKAADDSLKEKAAYKFAWALYHQDKFDDSHGAFQKQIELFPDGPLSADAMFMMAECRFRAEQFGEALALYQKAIPRVDQSKNTSTRVRRLARLHAAQSANKVKEYETAVKLASALVDDEKAEYFHEGNYELGDAYYRLNQIDQARQAWTESAKVSNAVGARSNYMLGELMFAQKDHDGAITNFEQVVYRYGGTEAPDDIKVWQALAAYEIARCYHVRIKDETDAARRTELIQDALKSYEYVVKNYPNKNELVAQSQKAIDELKRLQ
jgi:cellulose synthase operon protein C